MKKITLLFILCLTYFSASFGQCVGTSLYPSTAGTVFNDGTTVEINDNNDYGEYGVVNGLVIGNTYEITATNATGPVYLTIEEYEAPYNLITNDVSPVTFVATSELIYINYHKNAACEITDSQLITTNMTCTTCTCSSTLAPDVAVPTAPVNGATNVAIDVTDPTNKLINFAWSDNGAATSYDVTLVGVGTLSNSSNPEDISTNWEYSTTYDWNVKSINCLGEETSSNFSFTTESNPALSTEEFKTKLFTIYPNPTTEFLNIETNETINSVTVYNLLGKQIMFIEGNQILNNTLNVGNLTKGIYFITIEANGKNEKLKFIKQ
jgi:hypothetical protein